jgi:hypothetical protein
MTVLICCPIPIRKSDVAALDADAMAIDTPGNLSAVGIDQKPKIKREKKQKPSMTRASASRRRKKRGRKRRRRSANPKVQRYDLFVSERVSSFFSCLLAILAYVVPSAPVATLVLVCYRSTGSISRA